MKTPYVIWVSVLEMSVYPVLWLRQAQLFVICAWQCSDSTYIALSFEPLQWQLCHLCCCLGNWVIKHSVPKTWTQHAENFCGHLKVCRVLCTPFKSKKPYWRYSISMVSLNPLVHVNSCFALPFMHWLRHRCVFIMLYVETKHFNMLHGATKH